jgi:hypothetical protein
MIEDSQTPETEPKMRDRGPTKVLTQDLDVLLATRQRYEAALREIVRTPCSPWHATIAREALAAAPEGTP